MVANDPLEHDDTLCDRTSMVRATRTLLNSVTRVLLLADIVVVKQLLLDKDKVIKLHDSGLNIEIVECLNCELFWSIIIEIEPQITLMSHICVHYKLTKKKSQN